MKFPVYLDYHATTPVDPRVLQAMLPYFSERFGNASSRSHSFGWDAEKAVDRARGQVAELIGATAREIVFTSGATESDNLAIKGVAEAYAGRGNHIITAATEHKAVLDCCKKLEKQGWRITYLPLRKDGIVEPDAVRDAITEQTVLVTLMYANNEIGVIHPIPEIGRICRERGVLLHSDAVQAIGKIPVDVSSVDLMSMTGHKMYGPKGTGALYVRSGVRIGAQIDGGGQERGMRSGTLNVPGIVGFGEACAIAQAEMGDESARLTRLRDKLKARLLSAIDDAHINGSMEHRLPNNLNMSFAGVNAEALIMSLTGIALSSGSACTSGTPQPSYILSALGVPRELAQNPMRFGLGRYTTEEEIDYVAERVIESVNALRAASPFAASVIL